MSVKTAVLRFAGILFIGFVFLLVLEMALGLHSVPYGP